MTGVGFIGLGAIGRPMAERLAGWPGGLRVCDVDPGATAALESRGAKVAGSPREVAEQAGHVSVMVRDDEQVRTVLHGPDGVLAAARPVLDRLGDLVVHVGPAGAGTAAKLARNVIHFVAFAAVAEALDLALAAGLGERLAVATPFADIWTRDVLTVAQRRLLLIGMLAATGKFDILDIQLDAARRLGELNTAQRREIVIFVAHYAGWPTAATLNGRVEQLLAKQTKDGTP